MQDLSHGHAWVHCAACFLRLSLTRSPSNEQEENGCCDPRYNYDASDTNDTSWRGTPVGDGNHERLPVRYRAVCSRLGAFAAVA
jgi:hypothetical protein